MKIAIILGSVREGRLGERVARWATAEAGKVEGFELKLIDLKTLALPVFTDVSPSARTAPYADPEARSWSETMAWADGFIFVTAEYNHTIPGALNNAVDYLWSELTDKPAVIVSYSNGPIGGARAAEHFSSMLTYMKVLVSGVVSIGMADKNIDENGVLLTLGPDRSLAGALTRLVKLGSLPK
jgi:NAD(P)H-dependent FMN reductase